MVTKLVTLLSPSLTLWRLAGMMLVGQLQAEICISDDGLFFVPHGDEHEEHVPLG